jgi:hypothetical protein
LVGQKALHPETTTQKKKKAEEEEEGRGGRRRRHGCESESFRFRMASLLRKLHSFTATVIHDFE